MPCHVTTYVDYLYFVHERGISHFSIIINSGFSILSKCCLDFLQFFFVIGNMNLVDFPKY